MAGFDFSLKALKGGFFDADKIAAKAERANARAQSKFGAFTRRRMKSSIRYRQKPSAPGQPPSAHRSEGFTRETRSRKTGAVRRQAASPLRELIFFARDPRTDSVVIGPVVFGTRGAPALEFGGRATVRREGRTRTVFIRPRPFARPAGEAEAEKLPDLLRNMVK